MSSVSSIPSGTQLNDLENLLRAAAATPAGATPAAATATAATPGAADQFEASNGPVQNGGSSGGGGILMIGLLQRLLRLFRILPGTLSRRPQLLRSIATFDRAAATMTQPGASNAAKRTAQHLMARELRQLPRNLREPIARRAMLQGILRDGVQDGHVLTATQRAGLQTEIANLTRRITKMINHYQR